MERRDAIALISGLRDAAARRDIDAVAGFYAADAVAISPMFGEVRGQVAIAASWATLLSMFADITIDVADVLVDGDRVAILSRIKTTDRFGWLGQPATGSPIDYRMVLLLTIAGGRIVRDERIYDSVLVQERLEKARVDKELRTAADVQRTLLPRTAHVTGFCELVGDSVPCRAIGGDFFDFIEVPSGEVALAMGDVSGKGPAAALMASLIQGMIAAEAQAWRDPASTLSILNERLAARQLGARFATLVYAVLSPDGRLTYACAGHNPPALVTRDGIRRLEAGGTILGVFDRVAFEQETVRLSASDTVVMFTDGVTEARNRHDEEFGEHRLLTCLNRAAASTPDLMLREVFETVRAFCDQAEQSDDITVTVTRFR